MQLSTSYLVSISLRHLQKILLAGYVRRSSEMQKDNFSIDAQKRAITEAAKIRGLPAPIFYEDDERSARGEQIAKRPDFKRLLDDVQANKGRMVVMVHTLDRLVAKRHGNTSELSYPLAKPDPLYISQRKH